MAAVTPERTVDRLAEQLVSTAVAPGRSDDPLAEQLAWRTLGVSVGVDRLYDGRPVHIRPIRPTDAPAHEAFVMGLSYESRYLRFLGPKERLSRTEVEHFCTVDHVDREALVALVDDEMVAVARYERTAPTTAEVAFVVGDAWQGHGIGTLLLERLALIARLNGIGRFTAEVLGTNHRMIEVFRDSGFALTARYEAGGTVHVELDLQPTVVLRDAIAARHHESAEHALDRILRADR